MQETIKTYEKSAWWKEYVKRLVSPATVVCEICGKPHWHVAKRNGPRHSAGQKYSLRRFNVHHKNYRHPYKETKEDLMVLCSSCHLTGHALADLAYQNPKLFGPVYDVWKQQTGWESEYNKKDLNE